MYIQAEMLKESYICRVEVPLPTFVTHSSWFSGSIPECSVDSAYLWFC